MPKSFLTPIVLPRLSSDPTGSTASFYYNSSNNAIKFYNGTSWITLLSGANAALFWRYTATGGETTLSGLDDTSQTLQYTAGFEQVYINGVLQVRGSDYTATNGTSVVLPSALVSGDYVTVIAVVAQSLVTSGFAPTNNPTFTGTVVLPSTTSIGNVSSTEIGYLDGVTSALQTQIDSKLASSTAASTYAPIASPTFTGTVSGQAAPATLTTADDGLGYMGMPQNATTTGAYRLTIDDAGKHIYSTATRTVTIPGNATGGTPQVAFPIGSSIVFVAASGATVTIQMDATSTDTCLLAGAGTSMTGGSGSRTLAPFGMATLLKITATQWIISGNGLT